ncbi:GAF and ANTAR domain-containing protein [[Mycobacterium] burgundiense]|uniref:GAF and ANTAR domain-containing protein n=1 Tax=[Mycobacterium] burgundiense TaxID=3064286 RepID=A0ABN9NS03_9MYCO|nr:GAF and ANTAR domain-containing protein [Mycolicibacterium sp. MU0053]CAJ1510957.1 GAF and ANTAR domain-containing protein [Mycolicibacterium sp. MU0053]
MAELARATAARRATEDVLAEVTAAAVELIPGVDTAGVLMIRRNGFESLGGTTDIPERLDELQVKFNEGPCIQAALDDLVVRTEDFRQETRWPQYSPAVVEIGVLSGISFKLFTAERTAGALNLFGFQPHVWDSDAQTVGSVLAAHATAAILANEHGHQLETALLSRDRIGQAKGIIMERFDVDDVRAFDMLRQLSQESNIKLADIAQKVIDSRLR